MAMNKRWSRPQLVILGRGTPEEGVLKACKTGTGRTKGPGDQGNKFACKKTPDKKAEKCKDIGSS